MTHLDASRARVACVTQIVFTPLDFPRVGSHFTLSQRPPKITLKQVISKSLILAKFVASRARVACDIFKNFWRGVILSIATPPLSSIIKKQPVVFTYIHNWSLSAKCQSLQYFASFFFIFGANRRPSLAPIVSHVTMFWKIAGIHYHDLCAKFQTNLFMGTHIFQLLAPIGARAKRQTKRDNTKLWGPR